MVRTMGKMCGVGLFALGVAFLPLLVAVAADASSSAPAAILSSASVASSSASTTYPTYVGGNVTSSAMFSHSVPRNGSYFNVLLLNSYSSGFKWTDDITAGARRALDDSGLPYRLQVDYMDTKRINDPAYFQLFLNLSRYKYGKEQFDFVMTSDDDAFNFVSTYRDQLFPGVPFAFCGTNFINLHPEKYQNQGLISGINEDNSIKEGVDIALKLQPGIKNIYFIHDNTTTGLILADYIKRILPSYQGKYAITVWDGSMSGQDIVDAASTIDPKTSLIFLTIFSYDKNHKFYDYNDLLGLIQKMTNAPVYGTWDFNLGFGIVGGDLTSGFAQGNSMAAIAARVFRGGDIATIPVQLTSPNVYMFDHDELVRYGADMTQLPPGSIVINQPISFYEQYKVYIWVGVAAFALLILLIAALIIRDRFSALKRQELEKAIAAEELLNQSKSTFLAIAAHEMRTPLTIIRGNAELLLRTMAPTEANQPVIKAVAGMQENGVRLLDVLDDFLDVTQIEEKHVELRREPLDVPQIIRDVVADLTKQVQDKGIYLKFEEPQPPVPAVSADARKMREIIMNIVSNAVHYTSQGGITVSVETIAKPDEGKKVVKVSIADTGVGIAPENQGVLFQKFSTVSKTFLHSKEYGSGLGLYISKLLAEMMGGTVQLERSAPGEGSTFSVAFPAA